MTDPDAIEFVDEDDASIDESEIPSFSEAVLYASDWTVETVISQLERENIELNPRFQRRDAWTPKGKSRFIESIILGLPIPQIVLAEKLNQRGTFVVLDGKQRLLSLLQFRGKAEGPRNSFALSSLEVRTDLLRKRYSHFETDPDRRDDLNAFMNHTIRTVVIRNWPSTDFLHLVFLRLNTGTVKLSPQELRQAMVPGPFSDWVDDSALECQELQTLLSRNTPDPRMRDVELLVRFLAMRRTLPDYAGRMKQFLDRACIAFNESWETVQPELAKDFDNFKSGVRSLVSIFGQESIARKSGSRSFNRAIFDSLIFYASDERIRDAMNKAPQGVRKAYETVLKSSSYLEAIESDTAGIPHTFDRLAEWGTTLRDALGLEFRIPELVQQTNPETHRICYDGPWA